MIRHPIMAGWLDPRTQKATAFYLFTGVLASHIYHTGLGRYDFGLVVLMAGLGTVSGLADLLRAARSRKPPADPPDGRE